MKRNTVDPSHRYTYRTAPSRPRTFGHCNCCQKVVDSYQHQYHPYADYHYPSAHHSHCHCCPPYNPSRLFHPNTRKTKPCHYESTNYHVTVRSLNLKSTDTDVTHAQNQTRKKHTEIFRCPPTDETATEQNEMSSTVDINADEKLDSQTPLIPSIPCRKIISTTKGMSSTSRLITFPNHGNEHPNGIRETATSSSLKTTGNKSTPTPKQFSSINKDTTPRHMNEDYPGIPVQIDADTRSTSKRSSLVELSLNSDVSRPMKSAENSPVVQSPRAPQLPSSSPPNIEKIKSNEILRFASRSIRSSTALNNEKKKSLADIPLKNTRSTLDFGLFIDEVVTTTI